MAPTKTANNTAPVRYKSHIHIVKTDEDYAGRPTIKNTLYSDSGLVENNFDTLYTFTDFLVTKKSESYRYSESNTLYDMRTGKRWKIKSTQLLIL